VKFFVIIHFNLVLLLQVALLDLGQDKIRRITALFVFGKFRQFHRKDTRIWWPTIWRCIWWSVPVASHWGRHHIQLGL